MIWCRLANIQSLEEKWADKVSDKIYSVIDKFYGCGSVYAHVQPTESPLKSKFYEIDIPRYDVVLIALDDNNKQININSHLVELGLAKYSDSFQKETFANIPKIEVAEEREASDEEDWDMLDYKSPATKPAPEPIEVNDEDMLCNFTAEEFEEFIMAGNKQRVQNERAIEPIQTAKLEEIKEEHLIELECDEVVPKPNERLTYFHKRPAIVWQQDDEFIVLKIKADDAVEYNLKVTHDSLVYK